MKKRTIVILGFLVIIIISLLFLFFITNDSDKTTQNNTKQSQQKDQVSEENEQQEDNETEDNDEEDEQDNESNQNVKDIISEIVQGTIRFFSDKETNIVAVGDSLTQGVGDSENAGGYVGIMDRTINEDEELAHVRNFGKRGNRTDQLLTRLKDPTIATSISDADIILITIGANDIMQVVKENISHLTYSQFADERKDYEKRLRDIFDQITSLNDEADVYLIGFYNPFAKFFPDIDELGIIVDDWNGIGKKVIKDYDNTTYIPTKDLFENDQIDLFADDNFHPNDRGYKRMAKRVLNYLTEKDR